MATPTSGAGRIAAFTAVLAIVFAGAAVAGNAIDPDKADPKDEHMGTAPTHTDTAPEHAAEGGDHPVRGLAVADDGLRVVVDDPELRRGSPERLSFRIVGADGRAVRDFEVEHERRMHLIVVRRDLTGFQHLHPEMAADGTWTTWIRLDDAGSYRLFADFARAGDPHTLASDLRVDGAADLKQLPAPAAAAISDGGYEVQLDGADAPAGSEADLRFTITRDGQPVDVEPYLGAGGHLVALREGDMAFLHVHPTGEGTSFEATFPTPGRYRLFLQFKHEGRVDTAAFTREVR